MALAQTVLSLAHGIAATALESSSGFTSPVGPSPRLQLPFSRKFGQNAETRSVLSVSWRGVGETRRGTVQCRAKVYNVEMIHNGETYNLEVPEDETILSVAMDSGLDVPYDCKLGVCMTCPAKLEKGEVNQSDGMLSDDVVERGYALMCAAYPLSDCIIRTIPEEELLSLQLATADDL